jgi:flagellar hook protein FlgE
MFAGVSGLRAHQVWMDVIGNNIANVNTIGFKTATVTFQDALSQTMMGASTSTSSVGGRDPVQIGLGVNIGQVTNNFAQGSLQITNRTSDLSLQGDGFFIMSDGGSNFYTRAGSFTFDSQGKFVNPSNGFVLQGWMADSSGNIDTNAAVTGISIPVGRTMPPQATDSISYRGNLPADAAVGDNFTASISVKDSQGGDHDVFVTFTKTAANNWSWTASGPPGCVGNGSVVFNDSGLLSVVNVAVPIQFAPPGAAAMSITPDFGTLLSSESITQYASSSTIAAVKQNGYSAGALQNIAIGNDGVISGFFSNGLNQQLAQLSVCTFNNPGGLMKMGDSMYRASNNSGEPLIGTSGSGNRGTVTAGALEMSNVDLAQEFTNLIGAQRGFQANSRIITTVDQVLAEVVNIKR